ncbi:hypothetical protein [Acrocarpospora sp. B8E8]|uniref:hypothetical protein n=1 Tax=Acrocarpospora sp. B8E8 TaxID=3153572 RepID=UPI00325D0C94
MTALEARYRRLLRWYPQAHRAMHEEEMLGVLMAGAEPGRTRPKVAESADLIRGAVRIRLRHAFGPESAPSWRSAFAPVVLVAVLVTLRPDRPAVPYRKMLGWSALLVGAGLPQLFQYEIGFAEKIGFLGYEAEAFLFMLPLTVLAVLAGQAVRTATGRRTIVLAAVPVLLITGYDLLVRVMTGSWLFGSLGLLIPAVIMFVLARRGKPVPQTPVPG